MLLLHCIHIKSNEYLILKKNLRHTKAILVSNDVSNIDFNVINNF